MKNSVLFGLLIIGIAVSSCKSMMYTDDTASPTVHFLFSPPNNSGDKLISINGNGEASVDGVSQTFNFETQVLYLKRGNKYVTLISAKDDRDNSGNEGSLQEMTLTMPSTNIIETPNMPADLGDNWTAESHDLNTQTFKFTGNRMDVRDGAAIGPTMIPRGANASIEEEYEILVTAKDYNGYGSITPPNTTTVRLYIRINNDRYGIGAR